jgi:hypothetical protein
LWTRSWVHKSSLVTVLFSSISDKNFFLSTVTPLILNKKINFACRDTNLKLTWLPNDEPSEFNDELESHAVPPISTESPNDDGLITPPKLLKRPHKPSSNFSKPATKKKQKAECEVLEHPEKFIHQSAETEEVPDEPDEPEERSKKIPQKGKVNKPAVANRSKINGIDENRLASEIEKKVVLWDYRRHPKDKSYEARKVAWLDIKQVFGGKLPVFSAAIQSF